MKKLDYRRVKRIGGVLRLSGSSRSEVYGESTLSRDVEAIKMDVLTPAAQLGLRLSANQPGGDMSHGKS